MLGRDRVGICPLYYTQVDEWLLWGSEVRALLASGLVAAQPDARGIDHFFTFFGAGTTRTFFEGIKSLPPGLGPSKSLGSPALSMIGARANPERVANVALNHCGFRLYTDPCSIEGSSKFGR